MTFSVASAMSHDCFSVASTMSHDCYSNKCCYKQTFLLVSFLLFLGHMTFIVTSTTSHDYFIVTFTMSHDCFSVASTTSHDYCCISYVTWLYCCIHYVTWLLFKQVLLFVIDKHSCWWVCFLLFLWRMRYPFLLIPFLCYQLRYCPDSNLVHFHPSCLLMMYNN